jgi:hypothetical protein
MATRVELVPHLDRKVAEMVGRPAVDGLADQIRSAARRLAPDGKIWVTAGDERVRPSHRETDGQLIPGNLRYRLPAVEYVRKGRGPDGRAVRPGGWKIIEGRFDLARVPRDSALPVHQAINCRCASVAAAGAVARSIHRTPVALAATRASAEVYSRFTRVAESEFGTSEDAGAHFMGGAIREVAARLR